MTKFKIEHKGSIIGFQEHLHPYGSAHWYSDKYELKDKIPGPFPATEDHERVLLTKKKPNRREEKR